MQRGLHQRVAGRPKLKLRKHGLGWGAGGKPIDLRGKEGPGKDKDDEDRNKGEGNGRGHGNGHGHKGK